MTFNQGIHASDLSLRQMKTQGLTSFEGIIRMEDGTYRSMGEDD